jgi:uncharacterized protein (TIGR03437 family)
VLSESIAVLRLLIPIGVFSAVLLPHVEAQTGSTTPWAVLSTQSAAVQNTYLGPSAVTAAGDLYAVNSLAGASSATKTFGDASNAWSWTSKVSASGGFAVKIGGAYYINVVSVDAAGNVLIGGSALTTGLPITRGAYRTTAPGDHAGFVCQLSGTDGTPIFCTYLDSNQIDFRAIATDALMNVYILAQMSTGPIAATTGALSIGNRQIVLMKLDPTGSKMKFIADFGGSGSEEPYLLAADTSGNAYIAGTTTSPDFPGTAGSALPTLPSGTASAPGTTSFVAKVDATGGNILWASYGRAYDDTTAFTVDGSGQVYLAGYVNGLFYPRAAEPGPMFVRKFSTDGSAILWEKNLAGAAPSSIAVDSLGALNLVGGDQPINFPIHHSTALCPLLDRPGLISFITGGNALIRLSAAGDLLQSTFLSTRGAVQSMALSSRSAAGYIVSVDWGATSLDISQIGADAGGRFATTLGCVGSAATPANSSPPPPLAPGEIISIFGEGLGPVNSSLWTLTPDNRITSSLAGVQVTFDGVPAPLLYVQSSQINAVTPWSLIGKSTTQMCVNYSGNSSCATASVFPAVPTSFAAAASYGGAINEDGTLNTLQNPALAGSVISLFLTGLGPLVPPPSDGTITPWPAPSLTYPVRVWFPPDPNSRYGLPYSGSLLYSGPAPLAVGGLYQINVSVPSFGSTVLVEVTLPDGSLSSTPRIPIAVAQ